jgi:16S rRNA (adenine1518-N6/adenine1519-N6)-dimethyltransferase
VDIVPAGAFFPRPKVDSAIIRIDLTAPPSDVTPDEFFRIVRAGFGARRKQLRNALALGLGRTGDETAALMNKAHIDPARRAETLSIQEWIALFHAWDKQQSQT